MVDNSKIKKYTEKYNPRSKQNVKRRKEKRAIYFREHRFDVLNLTVAILALLVAIASLAVSIIALKSV